MNDNAKLWITGGTSNVKNALRSSEFIYIDKAPVRGPNLPFKIKHHTMIYYDFNSIYLIGGIQNGVISNKTWIINPNLDFHITQGPTLQCERWGHACGKMISEDGKVVIILAGGISDNGRLQNMEYLDPSSDKGWEYGKHTYFKYFKILSA